MAKILESPKLTDASESILYRSVRERFDSECAAEKDEHVRMTIEALADLVGDMVKGDTERCRLCLVGDKTLGGLYFAMQEKAKEICKPAPGKLTSYAMPARLAADVAISYFGFEFKRFGEVLEFEAPTEEKEAKGGKESDGPVSLFDLI